LKEGADQEYCYKKFRAFDQRGYEASERWVTIDELKAITKQMEELGWL
jgi:hypothetical protein